MNDTIVARLKTKKELIALGWSYEGGNLVREDYYSIVKSEFFLIGKVLIYNLDNNLDYFVKLENRLYWFSGEALDVLNTKLAKVLFHE